MISPVPVKEPETSDLSILRQKQELKINYGPEDGGCDSVETSSIRIKFLNHAKRNSQEDGVFT